MKSGSPTGLSSEKPTLVLLVLSRRKKHVAKLDNMKMSSESARKDGEDSKIQVRGRGQNLEDLHARLLADLMAKRDFGLVKDKLMVMGMKMKDTGLTEARVEASGLKTAGENFFGGPIFDRHLFFCCCY